MDCPLVEIERFGIGSLGAGGLLPRIVESVAVALDEAEEIDEGRAGLFAGGSYESSSRLLFLVENLASTAGNCERGDGADGGKYGGIDNG